MLTACWENVPAAQNGSQLFSQSSPLPRAAPAVQELHFSLPGLGWRPALPGPARKPEPSPVYTICLGRTSTFFPGVTVPPSATAPGSAAPLAVEATARAVNRPSTEAPQRITAANIPVSGSGQQLVHRHAPGLLGEEALVGRVLQQPADQVGHPG